MTQTEFQKLLKEDRYQVFLFTSPPSLPLSFAVHPWFVLNKRGALSRWEVVASPGLVRGEALRRGHVCKDALPPTTGLRVTRSTGALRWPSTLCGSVEGDEDSTAARMAALIEHTMEVYPHKEDYSYTGYNSNTYAQWVLNHFPESGLRLPWNAFGRQWAHNQPL